MTLFDLGTRPAGAHDAPVSLATLADGSAVRAVRLEPQDDPDALEPWLAQLTLIVLHVPIFRDGRPFTQARHLREYLKFDGEIRTEGHVLPDQAGFLHRCGVDTVVLPEGSDLATWRQNLQNFPIVYQRVMGEPRNI